eukprot:g3228.t1
MFVQPSKKAYETLLKRVKALEEELKRVRNEKQEASSFPAKVELNDRETRDRNSRRKNSWVNIYNEATALRKSKRLLGQEVETDDDSEWRVKWSQRVMGLFAAVTLICWVAIQIIGTIVFGSLTLISMVLLYYKNFSFVISKRLLKETNVVIILIFGLCIFIIEIARPKDPIRDPILGLLYVLGVFAFVFLDAVKLKSRVYVMVVGILFVLTTMNNIRNTIFSDVSRGIVLFKYTIRGNEYTFMKRSTQRSIFVQIVLFSMDGIYTIFKDKKQELMIFATGNIYRETGTASKEVEQKSFVRKIKIENVVVGI